MGVVYLLHFDEPLHHAQHYMGYADDLEERLARHRAGNGARLMEVVKRRGIDWQCVRTWQGQDRHFERRLKRQKNGRRLCPKCRGQGSNRVAGMTVSETSSRQPTNRGA